MFSERLKDGAMIDVFMCNQLLPLHISGLCNHLHGLAFVCASKSSTGLIISIKSLFWNRYKKSNHSIFFPKTLKIKPILVKDDMIVLALCYRHISAEGGQFIVSNGVCLSSICVSPPNHAAPSSILSYQPLGCGDLSVSIVLLAK